MGLLKQTFILLFVCSATSLAGCPQSHPYAYLNGRHCCKTEKEANRPEARDNPPCDGGRLEFKSRCCGGDRQKACPAGDSSCKTVWDDSLTAGLSYPKNRRHLCYINGELAKIIPFRPDLGMTGAFNCRDFGHLGDQLTEDGDHLYEEWQIFDKANSEWVTLTANPCWYEDATGRVDCLGVFANEVEIQSSTGGSTRAKTRKPDTRSCGRHGVGKWKRIKGKLKCVYIPICPGQTVSQGGYNWRQKNGYRIREC